MKLIDRYVTSSLLITGFFAVAVLSAVLVLGNVLKKLADLLVNHDAPWDLIMSFVAYIIPLSLTFTVPWGFLTAVLLVFGKMSAENELIALRATGISVPRVCIAVFVISVICVGFCLWINLDVAPRALGEMKNALYNIATNNPLAMFESDKVINEFEGNRIYVERNEGAKLYNLIVYRMGKKTQPVNDQFLPVEVVFAKNGWLETDRPNKRLLLHIYNGRYEKRDDKDPENLMKIQQGITMEESTLPISLEELYEKKKKRGLSQVTAGELLSRLNTDEADQTPKEKAVARTAALTEVNKRFSFSLASLAFALVGVPLAITAHRRETSIGFLLSLLVAFVYFLFINIADTMKNNPRAHPEMLVWSPNVFFIGIGLVLFYRLSRR